MTRLSLRVRLIISFLLGATAIWLVSGVLSWVETRKQMDEFFDTYQLLLARQLSTVNWSELKPDAQNVSNKIIENMVNEGEEDDDALGFAVFDNNGRLVFHDGENGKDFGFSPYPLGFMEQKIDGDKWRLVWIKSADESFLIAVGQELEFRDESAFEMIVQSLIPWGAGLIVLLFASIFLITRELNPVKKLASKIAARRADDLSPIADTNLPQEIEPLIDAMNKLLCRIGKMVERERGFISDAAHELRSPLAALRVQLDVAMIDDNDTKTRNKALDNLGKGIERANRLVEQLLALSKLEAGYKQSAIDEEDLNWVKLIDEIIEEHRRQSAEKNIKISVRKHQKFPMAKGKNLLWSLLLRNLVDNALKYSPKNAEVLILLSEGELRVINTKTKVDEKFLQKMGERFFRPSGQEVSGSGLGLSIVKRVAEIYNFGVEFSNTKEGFCVRVYQS